MVSELSAQPDSLAQVLGPQSAQSGLGVSQRALHDALAGMTHHALVLDRIEQALRRSVRNGALTALLLLEIDDFDELNETLGHSAGNDAITAVATRLRSVARPGDTVGRLAGDEFVLVLDDVKDVETVVALAQQCLAVLREPMIAAGHTLDLTATAGIAVCTDTEALHATQHLVADVYTALYAARLTGPGSHVVFDDSLREGPEENGGVDLAAEVSLAVARGEIEVFYQPLVRLDNGVLEGFEALARWRHPVQGLVSPLTFIPMAEETGAIHDIGRAVMAGACADVMTWRRDHGVDLTVSVNVSAVQLVEGTVDDLVTDVLDASQLPPERLVLEMTESIQVQDMAAVTTRLQSLRHRGLRVALDDFGTGYASLAYLRSLPLDMLKIDKSFLDDDRAAGVALLSGVTALGTTMGLDTVAEGIEDADQLERARAAGCTYAQGYLIARPMNAVTAGRFVADHAAAFADRVEVFAPYVE